MEILGSTFDDSVFEESRNKDSLTVPPSYKPKSCDSEWFCYHEKFEDVLDEQKTMKYRADLKYRKKQYQGAIEDYLACLPLVQNNNLSTKRDLLEGIARCYSHLGHRKQALETCEKLRKETSNTCHLTSVLQLELSIHKEGADLISSISILQQLCSIHPYNPWNWLQLATSYQTHLQNISTSSQDLKDTPEQDFIHQHEKETLQLKACMCFVRTRLLFEILRFQQFSFVLEKSTRALQVIEESLQRLQIKEKTLQTVSEVMAEDLNPEKMREENQDGEGLSGLTIKDFDQRWWNKLYPRLT
ncbi:uncharacterized protein C8orf76 [Trichomycterus rosablanca]|uniref:uncharacterized protein C8orf76 n=1 Tax=Trichomycterus rosablanca TaxID=2290929 RepID=UPI002F35EB59